MKLLLPNNNNNMKRGHQIKDQTACDACSLPSFMQRVCRMPLETGGHWYADDSMPGPPLLVAITPPLRYGA